MSGTLEFPTGADAELTSHLRAVYAAPADDAYWQGMEGRILGRLGVEGPTWWQVLGGWTRAGLIAAGIATIAAGLVALHSRQLEARAAYEIVLDASPALPAPMAAAPIIPGERDRQLRDILDY